MKMHRSIIKFLGQSRLLLCVLGVLCVSISGQEWKKVHEGVEYAQVIHKLGTGPVKIKLLRLDLTKVRLDIYHAMDAAIGTEKTSSIAARYRAVAAINAGFFRLDNSVFAGDCAGLFVVDGKLFSEAIPGRTSLWLSNIENKTFASFGDQVLIPRIKVGKVIKVPSGVNRERKVNELIVYTPEFGTSTPAENNGTEVIVENGRIGEVIRHGNNTIPKNGYVISAGGDPGKELETFRRSKKIEYGFQIRSWNSLENGNGRGNIKLPSYDVVQGVPQLLKNGVIDIPWEKEKTSKSFVETRHPRTAVAKLDDGKFLMITVDGRQPGVSVGMSLYELADYLLSIGAVDAMNLDGGGSTTMFLDGKVVNTPSDKEGERKVSDAILVTLRRMK
jgi:exopolysaccharide biosynthesis protein